jgi:hypothetical protein
VSFESRIDCWAFDAAGWGCAFACHLHAVEEHFDIGNGEGVREDFGAEFEKFFIDGDLSAIWRADGDHGRERSQNVIRP